MPLRVGTDFSGIEAPIQALRKAGISYDHVFASEVCPHALKVLRDRYSPRVVFGDAVERRAHLLPKRLDLYVAGFPCQKLSPAQGVSQKLTSRRPHTLPALLREFRACLKVLIRSRPKAFILENVPGLAHTRRGKVLRAILKAVALCDYDVSFGMLNAKDFGLFQSRERLFIVGLRSDLRARPFAFPQPQRPRATFASIRDRGARESLGPRTEARLQACATKFKHPIFMRIEWMCNGNREMPPTLTRNGSGTYFSGSGWRSSVREELRMQGFPEDFHFPDDMPVGRQRELVGNSMPVNVVAALLRALKNTGVFSGKRRKRAAVV